MTSKGKRKAKIVSPERPAKRRSTSGLRSDPDESEHAGEEDFGRAESQAMLATVENFKRSSKEDPFFAAFREEIKRDEYDLQQLVDEKQRAINDYRLGSNGKLRALLITTLSNIAVTPKSGGHAAKGRHLVAAKIDDKAQIVDPRPFFDYSSLLFAKSEVMLKMYRRAAEAISYFKSAEDIKQSFEKEKAECGRIMLIGEEVARRQIEKVLQKPEPVPGVRNGKDTPRKKGKKDMPQSKKKEDSAGDGDLDEIDKIFSALRQKRSAEDRMDGKTAEDEDREERRECRERPGFYPLLHDVERGARRWVKHFPAEEDMQET